MKIYNKADKLVEKLNYNQGKHRQRYTSIEFYDTNREIGIIKVSYFKVNATEVKNFLLEVIFYPNGEILPYKLFDKKTYKKEKRYEIPEDAVREKK